MIARYDGYCKVTGQKITKGVTEIVKIGGKWQVKGGTPVASGTVVTRHGNQYSATEYSEMMSEWDRQIAENDSIDEHNETVIRAAAAALTDDGVPGNTYDIAYRIFGGADVKFTSDKRRQIIEKMMREVKW